MKNRARPQNMPALKNLTQRMNGAKERKEEKRGKIKGNIRKIS